MFSNVEQLQIPLQELLEATNGFSDQYLIGRGGFGKLYKGVSVKHGNIAIKMLDPWQGQGYGEFKTEIALLSGYKHENIGALLGFCDEDGQMLLVYEYESNDSLRKHLNSTYLTWIQRPQICLDAARGLPYRLSQAFSPQSVTSSTTWKYDVFISFRGEDTRKTFVDHLLSTLEDRQIFTYKDDELLPRGEAIGPSLFKAIQESRIAIIVFSQNYATSSWCLDELAFIMKNKDERGQIVIPIFYDVEPSEVRKQTRYYRKALVWHMFKNWKKVNSWREALMKASNLSGWDPRTVANGHEAKAIKIICDDIAHKLLKMMTRTEASAEVSAHIDLTGVETRMQELKSFLKVGSGGVHMVGICGMWGSGNSTLASSIYNNISHEFEGCCFVKNVRAESRMHGLKTLQEKILSNVLKSKVMLKSIEQGIYEMERRLSQNSVLIVLDDVDHIDHLNMLAGSKSWFGNGSLIIITTRNQDLLNAHNVITRDVRLLDVEEVIEIFSRRAFGQSKL